MLITKTLTLITAFISVLSVQTCWAANIYEPGSFGHEMVEYIEPVFDKEITLVFGLVEEPGFFNNQVNANALITTNATKELLEYLEVSSRIHIGKRANATMVPGGYLPGTPNESVCVVIFKDKESVTWPTLLHEAMHCKNARHYKDQEFLRISEDFYYELNRFAAAPFKMMLEEALGAHLQVSYAANEGLNKGIKTLEALAEHTRNNGNSIGIRTARHALSSCSKKGACPTDTVEMKRMLMGSEEFKDLLAQDMDDYAATRLDFR